jgi:hypothetical protein
MQHQTTFSVKYQTIGWVYIPNYTRSILFCQIFPYLAVIFFALFVQRENF